MRGGWPAGVAVLVCLAATVTGGAAAASAGTAPAASPADSSTATQSAVSVESVTVDRSSVAVGETVTVEARVANSGDEPTSYDATLEVDGEAVETRTVGTVEPGFPVIVPFEYTVESAGEHTLSVGGAETSLSVEGDDSGGQSDDGSDGQSADDSGGQSAAAGQFQVQNVTVGPQTAAPGETVIIEGEVVNQGDEPGDFEAELVVDGEVVDTQVVPEVGTNFPIPASFEYEFDESGEYTVAISGVAGEETVTIEEDGGGGGGGLLGLLPLGILRPVVLFLALPILLLYLALKTLAIYLGY